MTNFLTKLSSLGTDSLYDEELIKKVRITNQVSASLIVICLPFILIYYFLNIGLLSFAMINVIAALVGVLMGSYYCYHNLSRLGLITIGNVSVFLFAIGLGEEAGNHHFFYASLTAIFVIFKKGEVWQKTYSFLLPIIGLFYVELTKITPIVVSSPSSQTLQTLNIANIIAVLTLIGLSQYYLFRENWISTEKMQAANRKYEDLTRQLEQRVEERTAELQEANQELSAYNYSVSHELRAPLRPIRSFAQMLKERYSDQLPHQAQQIVGEIEKSSGQLMRLIEGLLAFSRTGKQPLHKEQGDMAHLIKGVYASIRPPEEEQTNTIKLDINDLPQVHIDKNMFHHVIQNLLSNAIKYSADSNPIHIKWEGYESGDYIVFAIHDNGVGFDPEKKDEIFQAFQRLHSENQFQGSGVGLAITERIVRKHGGTIWAESTPGEGSSFYFSLPLH